MKLEVLSINCADSPVNSGRANKMVLLAREIKKIDPQIVFFQELVSKKSEEVLMNNLNDYHFFDTSKEPMKRGGLLIASKFQYVGGGLFNQFNRQAYLNPLSWSDWFLGKGFLSADIMAGKTKIRLVDVHPICNYFRSGGGQRALREQLKQLADYARKYRGKMLVSGDFNTIAGSSDYEYFMKESELTDPSFGKKIQTFNPEAVIGIARPFSRMIYGNNKLDYTLYKGFNPEQVTQKTVLNKKVEGIWLSDHYGLLTEVKL